MDNASNFMINLSVLYRNTQKYYDHMLAKYDIGSGQLMYLLFINENEGAAMQEITKLGEVDKGTTTKAISKLIDQGYIKSRIDEKDHRIRRLYCTEKASAIMSEIYELRNQCRESLAKGMDFDTFEEMLDKAAENSRTGLSIQESAYSGLKIGGMQKMTLLDYPEKVAATVFTAGCTFKCPYCHNKDLVFIPEKYEYFDPEQVMKYLDKRKGLLDGVCVSGGEPLMQKDLLPFIEKIKELGYLVKLDTNGYFPDRLKEIVESGLIDYVAMDIKNTRDKYALTLGMNQEAFNMKAIEESVDYLKHSSIDYEFRTTIVRELHDTADMRTIAKWIQGDEKYYLQQYKDSGNVIQPGFTAYNQKEMQGLLEIVKEFVPNAELRGVKED